MQEIPLTDDPEQLFNITLDGVRLELRVILNSRLGCWSLNITASDGQSIAGIGIKSGVDIVAQYPSLPIKNLYALNLTAPRLDPLPVGLGTDSKLLLLTDEEVASGAAV